MSCTLRQLDSDHLSQTETLLHEAANYEPMAQAPADLVIRALARRKTGIPLRTKPALVFACGIAILAFAATWIISPSRSHDKQRNLALAIPPNLHSAPPSMPLDRKPNSTVSATKIARNAGDRNENRIEKRPHLKLADLPRMARRMKIPVARWEEHVVREYRSGVLAPAVLLQPDPDRQEMRIAPAVVDIPLHYEVKPVSQTDMKAASPDAGWGGREQGE